jgi:hypothetical protein
MLMKANRFSPTSLASATASSCQIQRSAILPLRLATLCWASMSRGLTTVVLCASSDRRPHVPCSRWRNSDFARLRSNSACAKGHVKIIEKGGRTKQ